MGPNPDRSLCRLPEQYQPCPFCRTGAVAVVLSEAGHRWEVECEECGTPIVPTDFQPEGTVFDAEAQSRLEARLRRTNLGAVLATRGVTTVALNEHGELTEYRPDGTSSKA